jgi:hypothetical protein
MTIKPPLTLDSCKLKIHQIVASMYEIHHEIQAQALLQSTAD